MTDAEAEEYPVLEDVTVIVEVFPEDIPTTLTKPTAGPRTMVPVP